MNKSKLKDALVKMGGFKYNIGDKLRYPNNETFIVIGRFTLGYDCKESYYKLEFGERKVSVSFSKAFIEEEGLFKLIDN